MKDWSEALSEAWGNIPAHWKKAFLWALAVNCVVFFFDLAQFPLGDHDVGYEDGIPLLSGGRAGRWFTPVVHLLSGHVQIPVYTQMVCFVVQILASMGAVGLWWPGASFLPLFAGAVIVSCLPSITDFYYYHWMAAAFGVSQLFMVLSLHLCINGRARGYLRWGTATVLVTCAMASYQSSIMTWTTCVCGYLIAQLAEGAGAAETMKTCGRRLLPAFCCFCLGGILYAISLRLYPLVGLSLGLYQFQTVSIANLPSRVLDWAKYAWLHLFVPQGFISAWLKTLLFIGLVGGAGFLCGKAKAKGGPAQCIMALLCIVLFPLAAKSQFVLSNSDAWYLYRFFALGLNYVYAFFIVALLVAEKRFFRNCGFAVFVLAVPCMAVNDLDQQVRHVRAVEHDMAVLNRVVGRIEGLPEFDAAKTYNLVQIGRTRPYLADARGVGPHSPLQGSTVSQAWHPGFELWLLSKYLKLGARINEEIRERPDLMHKALRVMRGKRPFPAQESVAIIDGDTIVLFFDENAVPIAERNLKALGQLGTATPK